MLSRSATDRRHSGFLSTHIVINTCFCKSMAGLPPFLCPWGRPRQVANRCSKQLTVVLDIRKWLKKSETMKSGSIRSKWFSMRTWLCLSLIKRNNRNSSSTQLLASCSIESSESSSIHETTAALSATAILFSFLNLARDSADAPYNFAPAVMVTDLMNWSSVRSMQRDRCDLGYHKS